MSDKKIDIKTLLDDTLLDWFYNEIDCFYFLIDSNGNILHHSDAVKKFFFDYKDMDLFEHKISDLIGDLNYIFIKEKYLQNTKTDQFILLKNKIKDYNLNFKYQKYNDEENQERIFLLFKNIADSYLIKKNEQIDKIDKNEINFLSLFNFPVCIVNLKNYLYKNNFFLDFAKKNNCEEINSFIEFIKNNLNIDIFIDKPEKYNFIKDNNLFVISKLITKELSYAIIITDKNNLISQKQYIDLEIKFNQLTKTYNDEINKFNTQFNDYKNQIKCLYDEINNQTKNIQEEETKFVNTNNNKKIFQEIISSSSVDLKKMNEMIKLIEDIAIKIHLISINTAIESARTGEAGKSFVVIAREIAKLSDDIKNYISLFDNQIKSIKNILNKTTSIFNQIMNNDDKTDKSKLKDYFIKKIEELKSKL